MTQPWHDERQTAIRAVRLAARACQAVRDRLVTPPANQLDHAHRATGSANHKHAAGTAQTGITTDRNRDVTAGNSGVIAKQDRSPVTVADFASQAIVCRVLGERFAGDAVVGEENSSELRRDDHAQAREFVVQHVSCEFNQMLAEKEVLGYIDHGAAELSRYDRRHWTIDPIDGTKGFLRGDQYAIALALVEGGHVVVGALACPWLPMGDDTTTNDVVNHEGINHDGLARGVLLVAVRGQGVQRVPLWANDVYEGEPVRLHDVMTNDVRHHQRARFCESLESVHSNHALSSQLAERLGITVPPLRMDSQAKYGCVALGRAAIYLKFPPDAKRLENIWDHAAGSIVVEEAGGIVTDLQGKPLDFSQGRGLKVGRGIIACHQAWHQRVLTAMR